MPEKQRILVVDDDEVDRMAIRRALQATSLKAELEEAANGAAALEAMLSGSYDCIFLDYRLPPSDGLQVLSEARARGVVTPIVMLTGEGDEQLVTKVMRAGASDYLSKAHLSAESLLKSLQYVSRMYQAEQQQRQLASFPEQAPNPIIEVTAEGAVTYLNPAAAEVLPDLEALGQDHALLQGWQQLTGPLLRGATRSINREVQIGPSYYHLTISRAPGRDLLRIYAADITDRRKAEEQLIRSAFYDMLTNLPNRALFTDRLGRTLERGRRHRDHRFAVLFLDLDRFKVVNDSLGHLSGDQLLVAAANRLRACVRTEDTVARFGGDEFAVLIENPNDIGDVMYVADRIQREFTHPFVLDEGEVYSTTSIGIALSDYRYGTADDLLRDADIAMYRAKAQGGARCQVFDAEMHAHAITMLQLQTELRQAINRGQLQLHYQPIVSLASGRLVAFEALIRWQHPNDGLIGPVRFLGSARDTGIIIEIDRWAVNTGLHQMELWRQRVGNEQAPAVSINLSSGPFFRNDLTELLENLLRDTGIGLCPRRPILEITEATIMEDIEEAAKVICEIKELGFDILVDGFGTSSFSLTSLRQLPIRYLEIDRSFVSELPLGTDSLEIARTIITLARNLGIVVVAEGVENRAQLQIITDMHCELAKGYWFSRPMTAGAATQLIEDNPCWLDPVNR